MALGVNKLNVREWLRFKIKWNAYQQYPVGDKDYCPEDFWRKEDTSLYPE